MIQEKYTQIIAAELNQQPGFVQNTINLLESGATIPFIARYRKEMTGSMDEVVIAQVRDRLALLKELDAGQSLEEGRQHASLNNKISRKGH